jgi:hypothetical protein
MARPLLVRKPTLLPLRRLEQVLESASAAWQRRRAEVLLLYAAGHEATAMAHALRAHPNTIYADLPAFQQHGLRSVEPVRVRGAVARITARPSNGVRSCAWPRPPRPNSACPGAAGRWPNCATICGEGNWSGLSAASTCGAF